MAGGGGRSALADGHERGGSSWPDGGCRERPDAHHLRLAPRMHLFGRTTLVDAVMTSMDPRLQSAVSGIVALVHPDAVLLFGSRARGNYDDASDWDLFVVLPDDAPPGVARPSALRRAAAMAKLPIHAVACRRGVFEAKRNDPNSLSHDVARDGVVLYRRSA